MNTYDNTILYTDHLLASTIGFLKQHADQYDSALVNVSDHSESLGEYNVYMHGLPYAIAPAEQTDRACLHNQTQHSAMLAEHRNSGVSRTFRYPGSLLTQTGKLTALS